MPHSGREPDAARPASAGDLDHPVVIGETVLIIRRDVTLPRLIEGRAVILAAAPGPHRYFVQFSGDPVPKLRWVWPADQVEPAPCAGVPRDFADAHPEITDFFPNEDM